MSVTFTQSQVDMRERLNALECGVIPEAPKDGTEYARKDAGWVQTASKDYADEAAVAMAIALGG